MLLRVCHAAILALAAGLVGCNGLVAHERGLPARVDVEREAGPAERRVEVVRVGPERLEIAVLDRRALVLRRQVIYGTIEVRHEYNPNVLWELVEVPLGVGLLALSPLLWAFGAYDVEEAPDRRIDTPRNAATRLLGYLNPAQSMIAPRVVKDPTVDRELFKAAPRRVEYGVSLPVAGAEVRYRVLDEHGSLRDEGVGTTDEFGRVGVDGVPSERLSAEVFHGGVRYEVRLLPATTRLGHVL